MLNSTLRLEWLLVAAFDLTTTVLFTRKHVPSLLVWVSDSVVAGCAEENGVDTGTLFDRSCNDVAWIDAHFFRVLSFWVHSGYCAQITWI